jgi:hypothetical protein
MTDEGESATWGELMRKIPRLRATINANMYVLLKWELSLTTSARNVAYKIANGGTTNIASGKAVMLSPYFTCSCSPALKRM